MGTILVTGGAGYVGSHVVRALVESGETPVVLDDLSTGHAAAVGRARLIEADFADRDVLDAVLPEVDCVMHMAAFCEVSASVTDPAAYYRNNLEKGLRLLEAMRHHRTRGIVFSSTAAVYGEPEQVPIPEEHAERPTNPYGETKLAFERALRWYHQAYALRYVALRYFNAAGAHPSGEIGEDHAEETHLIPRLLRAAAGTEPPTPIFGSDYPTRDGTAVRDYVHVVDLALAHRLALGALRAPSGGGATFNLGNGKGFTVREVIDAVARVVGRSPATRPAPRRPGDPGTLVASSARARAELGWRPAHASLDAIVGSAWNWHRLHPHGYASAPGSRDESVR
jgi:UDP-glucose 4-epimerase